jgi:2'-hydroxyisoflavone reductase
MRLLVLGGTRFLGRHVVDAALARGHAVTVFTRGRSAAPLAWGRRVEQRTGDRDPRIAPGLQALDEGSWDAAIDTSGYVPRVVGAGARCLAGRVAHYTFVSSISVYADASRPGFDEHAAVAGLADAGSEDVQRDYGALKAACEREIVAAFGARSCIVRPGLIVGPHDPTDRFAYWVARFAHPSLLGERSARAVVPTPPRRPVQFVDARDLAAWTVDLAERRAGGAFNATSPDGTFTMGSLVDALVALARSIGSNVEAAWIDERELLAAGIEPWTGLPLWIPCDDAQHGAMMRANADKARGAGLSIRPLASTLADTAQWLAARANDGAWKYVLTAQAERALLAKASG